jgi:hypothetical protein
MPATNGHEGATSQPKGETTMSIDSERELTKDLEPTEEEAEEVKGGTRGKNKG